jgi:antitoxin (DNA-binding transcriptional repressor) of toxin-antitoxin stability system
MLDLAAADEERHMRLLKPWIVDQDPLSAEFDSSRSFSEIQAYFDAGNVAGAYRWGRSSFLSALSDDVATAILRHFELAAPGTTIELMQLGGALADVAPHATAFAHRSAAFELHCIARRLDTNNNNNSDSDNDDDNTIVDSEDSWLAKKQWTSVLARDIAQCAAHLGAYANFQTSDVDGSYADNVARLRALKQRIDPTNLFCNNHNIKP